MKLAFSTAWLDGDISRIERVIPYIDFLEIGTKGDRDFFQAIEAILNKSKIPVTSIHASAGPHKLNIESYYTPYFASPDKSLREKDIEHIAQSAEWADKIGAKRVIMHIGKMDDQNLKKMFLTYKDRLLSEGNNDELKDMKRIIIERRKMLGSDFLKSAISGLKKLCERYPEITFCIETRVHYYEIPIPDEAEYIFQKLLLPNLGYWHDIGHTYILSELDFVPMKAWQDMLKERCIGTHIHDVDLLLNDHLPPGYGILDFRTILSQFNSHTLHTMELNARHDIHSVLEGIEQIKNLTG